MNTIRMVFAESRIFWSRLFAVALLLFIAVSAPPWRYDSLPALVVEVIGFLLLAAATMGRLWCASYIAGRKDGELVREGPYSVVRNPLYVSNFVGGVGFGLAAENLIATAIIFVLFVIFYPAVVHREEKRLEEKFGNAFRRYKDAVPRWWPNLSLYHEPAEHVIRPRLLRRAYFNAMWFMWAFLLWEILEKLQGIGIIVPMIWSVA